MPIVWVKGRLWRIPLLFLNVSGIANFYRRSQTGDFWKWVKSMRMSVTMCYEGGGCLDEANDELKTSAMTTTTTLTAKHSFVKAVTSSFVCRRQRQLWRRTGAPLFLLYFRKCCFLCRVVVLADLVGAADAPALWPVWNPFFARAGDRATW